jgi:CheY-like chemotaxis protein
MARLVVISASLAGSAYELGEAWATIGRADGNTFQIVEASVSGRHCEVRLKQDELTVRDLLSTNGTFINGQKISEGVVKPGQTLRLGEMELRFEGSGPAVLSGAPFNSKMLAGNLAAPTNQPSVPEKKPETAPPATDAAGKKFQVLFVDDSLAFLESFSALCAEFSQRAWQIHTATSADRALALMQERPMDLIVLDIGMPMLDGLQLLGILTRRYPGIKIAVLTGNATDNKRTDALAKGAELFLEKPVTADGMKTAFNVLNDLVSWNREGFTGALRQVGLQEIIQIECNGRHSSILEVRNAEASGEIYIEAGVITHAAVGQLAGEQAFRRLLSFKGGEFQLKPFKAPPQRTITEGWEFLLLEAARKADEETVLLKYPEAAPAPPPAPPVPPASPAAEKPAEDPAGHDLGDEIVVVATYDGKWKKEEGEKK